MFNLFKPKVFNEGYLPEKDGHKVYFMEAGNPKGKPVLVFHGGPGGSAKLRHAYAFDRKKYRVILFDQRGSGKSLPSGEMMHNTTQDLIADAERLLEYLKIDGKLIVRGGSWGSTLAMLFAEKNAERVEKLLLSQIFWADDAALQWLEHQNGLFYPDILAVLKNDVKAGANTAEYYADLINSQDLAAQVKAVALYGSYERQLGKLNPKLEIGEVRAEDITSTRIYINYIAQKFMLPEGEIVKHLSKISHIPTLIVHNRLDFACPVQGAYDLHQKMPHSTLVIVPDIGHSSVLLHKAIDREIKMFLA